MLTRTAYHIGMLCVAMMLIGCGPVRGGSEADRNRVLNDVSAITSIPTVYSSGPSQRPLQPSQRPTTQPSQRPGGPIVHIVKRGETAWDIAMKYGVSLRRIRDENGIADVRHIKPGDRITIPGTRTNTSPVRPRTQSPRPQTPYKPPKQTHRNKKSEYVWPIKGRVINRFGDRINGARNHGINILARTGQNVLAAREGTVRFAGQMSGFGNVVIIEHTVDESTVYGYNSRMVVYEGKKVRQGQIIAKAGHSGRAEQTMLHFRVLSNGQAVDPLAHLP